MIETLSEPAVVRDARVESLLEEWGIAYELDEHFPLARLEIKEHAQVRVALHRAPQKSVEEFTLQMRHGAIFPPLVASTSGTLIDGNTRRAAALAVGLRTFATYLVKLPRPDFAQMIGAALNQMGGERLTAEEAFQAAEPMIRSGFTDENIARILGKSRQSVSNYRAQHAYEEAAERVGLQEVKLPGAVQRQLVGITMDEPFKAAVHVAKESKLSEKQAKELVTDLRDARSEQEQIAVVATFAEKHKPAGPRPRTKSQTANASRSREWIDKLLSLNIGELAPATMRAELEPRWQALRERADVVLAHFAEAPVQETIE